MDIVIDSLFKISVILLFIINMPIIAMGLNKLIEFITEKLEERRKRKQCQKKGEKEK